MRLNELKTPLTEIVENTVQKYAKKFGFQPYDCKVNPDNSVDVNGNVSITAWKFTKLPFKFGRVTGEFTIRGCDNLTTLENSPDWCKNFDLRLCEKIKDLKGLSPDMVVSESFHLFHCNGLKSLEGSPKEVGAIYIIDLCENLTSLKGLSKVIKKELWIRDNDNLKGFLPLFKCATLPHVMLNTNLSKLENFINTTLGNHDIMEVQELMIEAGFEEYAK